MILAVKLKFDRLSSAVYNVQIQRYFTGCLWVVSVTLSLNFIERCQHKTQLFVKTDGTIPYEWMRFNCANAIVLVPHLKVSTLNVQNEVCKWYFCNWPNITFFFSSLSFNLLIGWQLSIRNCCKPFFSLLYYCQLLCFLWLALRTVVKVFPRPFFQLLLLQGCLLQARYIPNYVPYPSVASIL